MYGLVVDYCNCASDSWVQFINFKNKEVYELIWDCKFSFKVRKSTIKVSNI